MINHIIFDSQTIKNDIGLTVYFVNILKEPLVRTYFIVNKNKNEQVFIMARE